MYNSKRIIFIGVSLVLAIIITLCPLSIVFADDEPVPTPIPIDQSQDMWHDSALAIIWAMLHAWDIDITYDDLDYYTEEAGEQITDYVIEYLDTLPSVGSIIAWTQLWTWGSDFWGNVRMNSSMLEDIEDFANWLITKFNLTDNSTVVLNGNYSVNGFPIYNMDTYYYISDSMGGSHSVYSSVSVDTGSLNFPDGYVVIKFNNDNNYWKSFIFFSQPNTSKGTRYTQTALDYSGNEEEISSAALQSGSYYASNYGFWFTATSTYKPLGYHPNGEIMSFINDTAFRNYMTSAQITLDGRNKIVTGNINLPSDDLSYTSGDGMTIVDGNPVYGQVEVVNPITVNNLPAIVSTGRISNLDVSSVTLPFSGFITMMGDGLDLITDIIYNFPSAIVAFALAIISATIVFGVIKVLKEH